MSGKQADQRLPFSEDPTATINDNKNEEQTATFQIDRDIDQSLTGRFSETMNISGTFIDYLSALEKYVA